MSQLQPAQIDVVVPVHDVRRPLARLLRSVLTGTRADVRVIVVCHDIEPDDVRTVLARDETLAGDLRIELVGLRDGVRSPAGPLARGLELVRARYFTKIDSDDSLAPGALDAWLAIARRTGAHAVMPVMDWPGSVPTPPLRPLSLRAGARLDPVADRLAYRTSTMGLLARSLRSHAIPTPGLATGEDIVPGLRVWFSGARIVWGGPGAAYRVHDDGVDRATAGDFSRLGVAERLGFVGPLATDPVLLGLGAHERAAIAAKVLRVQVFGTAAGLDGDAAAGDVEQLRSAAERLMSFGDAAGALSRGDARLLRLLLDPGADAATVGEAARARARRLDPRNLLPARAGALLRPDGTPRIEAAFAWRLATARLH